MRRDPPIHGKDNGGVDDGVPGPANPDRWPDPPEVKPGHGGASADAATSELEQLLDTEGGAAV